MDATALPLVQPITTLLSSVCCVIGSCPDSALPSEVERFFNSPEFDRSLSSSNQSWEVGQGVGPEEHAYLSVTHALIGRCSLPLAADDASSIAVVEYETISTRAEAVSRALITLLSILSKNRASDGAVAPWTNPSSRSVAQEVMRALLEAGRWTDCTHMLVGDRKQEGNEPSGRAKGILGGVLNLLQPQLNKDSMFRSDAVKLVFSWTLLLVTRPTLSQHLPRLLPPSLLLADHFRPENCIMGVRCLHHIVLNTACAELRQLNRADVVFEALFRLLYNTQPQVTQVILLCLMDLLMVLEKPPSLSPAPSPLNPTPSVRPVSHHDAVLRLVLTQMEAEHKVALRRIYASALPPLVDRCGIAVCRHLKRLGRVILGYMEVSDAPYETSRIQALKTLNRTLRTAWPRMEWLRVEQFLRALLRLLVDVSDSNVHESVKKDIFDQSAESIRLLDVCSHRTLQCLLLQVNSGHCSPEVLQILHSAVGQSQT